MLKKIVSSFLLAFHNIRSHFFHTLLSVLGIVIGVAALVSILSLIDGLEEFAKDQITKTTSLKATLLQPNIYKNVNGVRMRKDTFSILGYNDYLELKSAITKPCKVNYMNSTTGTVTVDGKQIGAILYGVGSPEINPVTVLITGSEFTREEIKTAAHLALVNLQFLKAVDSLRKPEDFIGKEVSFMDKTVTIKSVFDDKAKEPHLGFPLPLLSSTELRATPPVAVIEADEVQDVPEIKSQVTAWLAKKYKDPGDFHVVTNDMRVEQTLKGFFLFRVIMGLIVGISVVVGGIGIMNVLLISITERTVEIGIRKAVGANRRDIILQFLAESITVSVFGSMMGLIIGILGTMAVIPIIKALTEIPFQANYTLNTLMVVSILAVLLGIVFGTYPAMRAARLDPVEAIRRE